MKNYTSRERILTTLTHREPDRIPFDLGGANSTGIYRSVYNELVARLDLPCEKNEIKEVSLAKPTENILQKLGVDVRGIGIKEFSQPEVIKVNDGWEYIDEWGRRFKRTFNSLYFDIVEFPFRGEKDNHLPDISREHLTVLVERARSLQEKTEAAICFKDSFGNGFLQMGAQLWGYDQWFYMLAAEPEKAAGFMDQLLERKLAFWEMVLDELDGLVNIVCEQDDLGMQNGLWISREMYRKLIWPRQKILFNYIKKKAPHVFTYLHSCGAIAEIIPDLIEAGVDIINPVQVNAKGMNTKMLKKLFGKDIVFWGGGVDTQYILPRGNPKAVQDEVKRRIDDLAPGGGFVFAAVHNIQPDVPVENVYAMWEAFRQWSVY